MTKRQGQGGIGMIGFLLVAIIVLAAALMAFRTIPSYIEYYTIKKALEGAMADTPDGSAVAIQKAFERRIGADYVDSVSWRDLVVTRQGNDIVGNITWEKKLPLFYNVSLLMDFDLSVAK